MKKKMCHKKKYKKKVQKNITMVRTFYVNDQYSDQPQLKELKPIYAMMEMRPINATSPYGDFREKIAILWN